MEGACIRERLVLGKDLTLVICTRNDLTAASRNIVPATVTLVLGKDLMIVTCTRNDLTAARRNWNTVPKPGFQKKNHTKTPMCSNAQRFLEESMQQDTTAPCGAAASRHSLKDLKKKKKKKNALPDTKPNFARPNHQPQKRARLKLFNVSATAGATQHPALPTAETAPDDSNFAWSNNDPCERARSTSETEKIADVLQNDADD
jgi:hypothetical protein